VVHAADTGDDDELDSRVLAADGLSPLQRMQCIANSLPATTVTQSVPGAASSRQLLPPVTAEQMAACEDTNTDDVVAKVRRTRITLQLIYLFIFCLQCFDTVGWAAGRASGL